MKRIKAQKLLSYSTQDLWDNLSGDFILVFADGELVTNERETIYSSYIWDMLRAFPNTPISKKHHVRFINKEGETGAGAHLKLLTNVYWSVFDAYGAAYSDPTDLTDRLSLMSYEITNVMYNELSTRLEEYVTSLDITDFTAITQCPDIANGLAAIEPTEEGMEKAKEIILSAIHKDPRFKRNPLAVAVRTGISRVGQALQCLGPRGFITDIDSNIFRYPVMHGYIDGLTGLYESMVESRSAAKSQANSEAPLKTSEYFSRRQQLICQTVRNLHFGDCGSTNYIYWPVRDVRYEGTTQISDGDLKTIVGKYYMDDESGKLKIVRESDTHLLGKTIKMRSIIAGCRHPDPYGICSTCYGEAGLALPANTNLGHVCCVSMTAILGQLILSTKHFDGSSVVEGIVLRPWEKNFLAADLNGNSYYLGQALKAKKKVLIRIPEKAAPGLPDLARVADVRSLNITRTSEFSKIAIVTKDEHCEETTALDVVVNARVSSMSHDFLAYAKKKGYTVVGDGTYEFDMSEWDYTKELLVLPLTHFSMSDHQNAIAKMLEMTLDDTEKRTLVSSPQDMVINFHDLVNRRLSVNLSVLEVVLYASMVVDSAHGDFALPKAWTTRENGAMRAIFMNRSMSGLMAFQNHRKGFTEPVSFINTNRPDHILDHVFMPEYFNSHPDARD